MKAQRKEQTQRNDLLRKHRIERNWRQQDVADHLGTTVLTIQRWERGSQKPSAYYRIKLSTLFGVSAQDLGLLEDSSDSIENVEQEEAFNVVSSKEVALWTLPYTRNPHFTGRDEVLDQITEQFTSPTPTPLRQIALTQSQAIKGLGGIGKTQIAVEYAYRAREQGRYFHTLWVNAANEETILTSFVTLAALLPNADFHSETDQRKLVAAFIRWLELYPQPWLLIMDNADDLSLVQPFLPRQGNGHLLFTTRANAVSPFALSIEVETMGLMEGTQLLLRRALRFDEASDETINEAGNIVIALGYFPLALDQAGAYIEETGCPLQDYLYIYEQHRHELLKRRGKQATAYPESVATTWSLSFQHVERVNPAATELLRLCAFVSPDHIPEELLTKGAPFWPPLLQEAVSERFSFNQMLETLLAFSLVKRLSENRLISLHRLVQVVQMEQLGLQEQRQWTERFVQAVNAIFPRYAEGDIDSWPLCLRYLEQVQACDVLIQQHHLLLHEAAELLDRTGTYLRERALYSLAEPLYKQALHIWEQQEKPDVLGKAQSLHNIATIYYWQDKLVPAELFYLQALSIRQQELGPEHLSVADTLHCLGGLYRIQMKYSLAEPLYQQALRIREQQLGPDSLHVAETLNGLATLYEKLGKKAEAMSLTKRALHIREQQLGPEHLYVAETLNDLAILYSDTQGKQQEAEALYLRAISIWEQLLGPENIMITYSMINLALDYRKSGNYADAEPLYRRVLHIREQHLGVSHRNLVSPLTGLAFTYLEQEKYEQAEQLFSRALRIGEQQVGPEHTLVASVLEGLGHLYSIQDKSIDAEQFFLRALRIREKNEHSDKIRPLRGLANLYTQQGRYAQAEPLYQQALRIGEQQLGPEHLDMAQILSDFAEFQRVQGFIKAAIPLNQKALSIREHILGENSPLTVASRERLQAQLLWNQGVDLGCCE